MSGIERKMEGYFISCVSSMVALSDLSISVSAATCGSDDMTGAGRKIGMAC